MGSRSAGGSLTDGEVVELMMLAAAKVLRVEGNIVGDMNTPLVREVMRAILKAQREVGVVGPAE